MTGTRKCEKLPKYTSSRNENYNVIYELRQNVLLFPKTTRGDKSAFESGVDSVASCIFRVSSQAAKTYCLWNKFINNRVKEWDLPKFDADWKSFIAFVAEWSPNCQVWQLRMRVNFKILSKTLNSTSAYWWVLWEGIVGISILYPEYFYI